MYHLLESPNILLSLWCILSLSSLSQIVLLVHNSGHRPRCHMEIQSYSIAEEDCLGMYAFLSKKIFLRILPVDFSSYFIGQNDLMCLCLIKKTVMKIGCLKSGCFYSWNRKDGSWISSKSVICSIVCLATSPKKGLLSTYNVWAQALEILTSQFNVNH